MDDSHPADVLVICQSPDLVEELVELLADGQLQCQTCGDLATALDDARRQPPGLILCDTLAEAASSMPFCEQIRREPALAEVPLMFLSAAQGPDVIRRRHPGGGVYHVRKPFDPQMLVQLARRALGREAVAAAR